MGNGPSHATADGEGSRAHASGGGRANATNGGNATATGRIGDEIRSGWEDFSGEEKSSLPNCF